MHESVSWLCLIGSIVTSGEDPEALDEPKVTIGRSLGFIRTPGLGSAEHYVNCRHVGTFAESQSVNITIALQVESLPVELSAYSPERNTSSENACQSVFGPPNLALANLALATLGRNKVHGSS